MSSFSKYYSARSRFSSSSSGSAARIRYIKQEMMEGRNPNANILFRNENQLNFIGKEEELGEGSYGKVTKTKYEVDPGIVAEVAVKRISPKGAGRGAKSAEKSAVKEVEMLEYIKPYHKSNRLPHLPFLFDYFKYQGDYYLILEYIRGAELYEWLQKGGLTASDKVIILYQSLKALDYLHKKHVVHNDIKLQNIMYHAKTNTTVIDFGLSCLAATEHELKQIADELAGKTKYNKSQANIAAKILTCTPYEGGTRAYFSPERYLLSTGQKQVNGYQELFQILKSGDVFALGLTMFFIFAKKTQQTPGGGSGDDFFDVLEKISTYGKWEERGLGATQSFEDHAQDLKNLYGYSSLFNPDFLPKKFDKDTNIGQLLINMCNISPGKRPSAKTALRYMELTIDITTRTRATKMFSK